MRCKKGREMGDFRYFSKGGLGDFRGTLSLALALFLDVSVGDEALPASTTSRRCLSHRCIINEGLIISIPQPLLPQLPHALPPPLCCICLRLSKTKGLHWSDRQLFNPHGRRLTSQHNIYHGTVCAILSASEERDPCHSSPGHLRRVGYDHCHTHQGRQT